MNHIPFLKKTVSIVFLSLILHLSSLVAGTWGWNTVNPDGVDTNPPPLAAKYFTNVSGPFPSNDWWPSLLCYAFGEGGNNLIALPLQFSYIKGAGNQFGLSVYYFDSWGTGYVDNVQYGHGTDFFLRATNLRSTNGLFQKVSGWGDWNVKDVFGKNNQTSVEVVMTKGSPFLYATFKDNKAPFLYFNSTTYTYFDDNYNPIMTNSGSSYVGDHIGVRLKNGKIYGIYAASNTRFTNINGKELQIKLGGTNRYLSIAALPAVQDLGFYHKHAYAFITNTRVVWQYNSDAQEVVTTYHFDVQAKRPGFSDQPLVTMLPHQWKHYNGPLTGHWYYSPRGRLKAFAASTYETRMPYNGIILDFNKVNTNLSPTYTQLTQLRYLSQFSNDMGTNLPYVGDTYWQGKKLIDLAQGIMLADKLGPSALHLKNMFMTNLRRMLNNWYTYDPMEGRYYFTYWGNNPSITNNWGVMIGYKTSYGSENLTDHHYHYGYFVYASAVMAMFDPGFKAQHQNIVEMLIRSVNSPIRGDALFPFLRCFDPYEGHCWAGGKSDGYNGNNQESTSESMNMWTGIYLWGLATGQDLYRDLGIYGYTTERNAELQYWYDVDGDNWNAPGYTRNAVGILWGSSQSFATFFGTQAEYVYGIHWLPVTLGLMYLGYNQDLARNLYEGMCDVITAHNTNGYTNERGWENTIWSFQALYDPKAVLEKWDSTKIQKDELFYKYHYIHNLDAVGAPVTDVRAYGVPTYQVFRRNGTNTYFAFNSTSSTQYVRFVSDSLGTIGILKVPPGSTESTRFLQPAGPDTNGGFKVIHDGMANVGVPERFVVKAMNLYSSVMPSYAGQVTLSVTGAGPVTWSTNGCNAKGSLLPLAGNKALYTFNVADRGIVTLKITDNTVESLKIKAKSSLGKTNSPVYPHFLKFKSAQTIHHFSVVHDGLAEITRPEKIIVKALDSNGELVQNWTGLVSLSVAPGTNRRISWRNWLNGNNGTLTSYPFGRATYDFTASDRGVVTLMVQSSGLCKVDPRIKNLTAITDDNTIPRFITFKEKGWNIYVSKANSMGPWDGKYWYSAYQNIQDAVGDYSDGAENNILIAAGFYNEYVRIDNVSGTPDRPLSIKGYTNGVIISSAGKVGQTIYGGPLTGNIPNMLMLGTCRYTTIENLTFTGASNAGLFLWYGYADSVLRRLVFYKNGGAGLSAIAWNNRNLIENCVAISNGGSGMLFDGGSFASHIRNNIIAYNAGGGINTDASNKIDYNNVYGQGAPYQRQASIYRGPYNISEDSQFLSMTLGDPNFLKIPRTSPCVDKGDPGNDVDSGVYGLHIDIGAHEYDPYPQYIRLRNPNGGELYTALSNHLVSWSNNGASSKVRLELYRGPLLSMVLVTNHTTGPIYGNYSWAVPNTIPYATNYRILIVDETNTWLVGRSATYFTITNDRFFWVTYPNGGQRFLSGATITNKWRSTNVSAAVRLDIYRGDLMYYSTILTQTANDGSHVWTIPSTFGYATNYRLRVTDYSNRLIYDQSDLSFTITNSVLISSNVTYVDKRQRLGPWNGFSWETAYTNIQSGLSNLKYGSNRRVLVRPGIYQERVRFDETFYSGKPGARNSLIGVTNGVIIDAKNVYDYPLYISGPDNIMVSNVTLINGTSHGAYLFVTDGHRLERVISAKNGGAGLWYQGGAYSEFVNCTFWSNVGAGLRFAVGAEETNAITNCIMQQNGGDGFYASAVQLAAYNNSWGNGAANFDGGTVQGPNDLSADSLFDITSRYNVDFLSLRQDSPCRDIGKPSTPVPTGGGVRVDLGAKEGGPLVCPAVSISTFTPARIGGLADFGDPGDLVQITGSGFRASKGIGSVYFGALKATVYEAWSNTGIAVRVPKGFVNSRLTVSNSCGFSAVSSSTLKILKPAITGFTPAKEYPGATITVYGSGFGSVQGVGQVLFKDTPGTVASWSSNQISVIVPNVSGTNYLVVENMYGRAVSTRNVPLTNLPLTPALAWASSGTPSLAFDNIGGSRWESAFSDPQWIGIDLGTIRPFNRIVFNWQNAKSARHLMQISTNTNMGWTLWKSNRNTLSGDYATTNIGKSVKARYVRMYGYDRVGPWGHSIYEMDLYLKYTNSITSNFMVLTNTAVPPSIQTVNAFCTNDGTGKVIVRFTGRDPFNRNATYVTAQYSTNRTTWNAMTSNNLDPRHSPQPLAFTSAGAPFTFVWNSTNNLGRTANPSVWVRLQAYNGISNSTMSTSALFLLDSARPPLPLHVSPSNRSFTAGSVPYVWNRVSDPVGGVTNYRIVVSSNNFISTQRSYWTLSSSVTNWTPVPALGAGTWRWKVRAMDKFGNLGSWSTATSNIIDVTPPGMPVLNTPFSNAVVGSSSLNFRWNSSSDAQSGITGYIVDVDNISSAFLSIVRSSNVQGQLSTNATMNVGTSGTKYWRVRAVNGSGIMSSYMVWSFTVDLAAPAAPRLVTPLSNSITSNRLPDFKWRRSLSSDVSNYRIDISSNLSFAGRRSNWNSSSSVTNWTPPIALSEGLWYWRVASKDRAGNISSFTTVWTLRIDRNGPIAPQLSRPVSGLWTNASPMFIWNRVTNYAGIAGYEIQLASNASFSPINTSRFTNVTNFIRTSILGDANWYWRIRARDNLGNAGAWSATNLLRMDRTIPNISLLGPADGSFTSSLTNDFSWNGSDLLGGNPSGISNYLFLLDTDNNPLTFEISKLTNGLSFRHIFLGTSTNHWKVRVRDKAGNTNWSALFTLNIVSSNNLPPPVQISGITVDDGQHLVTLTDAGGYSSLVADGTGLKLGFALSGTVNSSSSVRVVYYWNGQPVPGTNELVASWNGSRWECEIPKTVTQSKTGATFYFQVLVDIYRIRNFHASADYMSWGFQVRPLETQDGNIVLLNNLLKRGESSRVTAVIQLEKASKLSVKVFSINGDLVRNLMDEQSSDGTVVVPWDGRNADQAEVGAGLYFLNIRIDGKSILKKVVVK